MKEISFRIATKKDRDFIRQLSASVFSIFGRYDEILTGWFLHPGVITIIGSKNGQPVAFAMLQPGEKETWNAPTGELLAIAVMPEHQGQGVGRALLNYMEDLALRFRLSEMHLHTGKDNLPAQYLFEKAGYKIAGAEKSYYPKGQSAVRMVKMLDQKE
jgi:ribosomal protein S18 acetylase RimI-like enzyme